MRKLLRFKRLVIICAIVVLGFAAVYPGFNRPKTEQTVSVENELLAYRKVNYHQLMRELKTKAARFRGECGIYIKDLTTQQRIDINGSRLFPSASLVKVPIMAAVHQARKEGKLSLDDTLELRRQHKVRDCSKLYFARNGSRFSYRDLIERMITESDNTATNMLTDALGFGYLNQTFLAFGLRNTDLRRGVMDLKWRRAGIENYTTPEDMALLLEQMYRGKLVNAAASEEMLAVLKRQKHKDRIPRRLPEGMVVAHKTGLLRDTVSDCGIVFTREGDFVICVLTDDIRNFKLAKSFISSVAACTYDTCYSKS